MWRGSFGATGGGWIATMVSSAETKSHTGQFWVVPNLKSKICPAYWTAGVLACLPCVDTWPVTIRNPPKIKQIICMLQITESPGSSQDHNSTFTTATVQRCDLQCVLSPERENTSCIPWSTGLRPSSVYRPFDCLSVTVTSPGPALPFNEQSDFFLFFCN